MRVTFLASHHGAPQTGGELYNDQLCQELRARGCRVRALPVYPLRFFTLVWLIPGLGPPLSSLLLAPFLAWLPGLVLEDEHVTAYLIGTNLLRKLARRGPLAIVVHHMEDARHRGWQWLRLASADLLIATSEATREELLALGLPPERVVVIPPGFEPRSGRRAAPPDGPLQVLCVGGSSPRKGYQTLLEALRRLPPGLVRVRVAGSTDEPHYRRVLRPLARGLEVTFEGRVSAERLEELYAGSHLFVHPSLQEGFSLAVSEAMHAGLPVLASDLPVLRERVELRFAPGDAAALAQALRQLAGERSRLAALGQQAREAVEGTHGWSRPREAFWQAVRPLVEGSPR